MLNIPIKIIGEKGYISCPVYFDIIGGFPPFPNVTNKELRVYEERKFSSPLRILLAHGSYSVEVDILFTLCRQEFSKDGGLNYFIMNPMVSRKYIMSLDDYISLMYAPILSYDEWEYVAYNIFFYDYMVPSPMGFPESEEFLQIFHNLFSLPQGVYDEFTLHDENDDE